MIGTLSLDVATGDLVRFRFSFTRSAYLDHSVEDITIVLENARLDGRWWLPWRQEVEIRRRATWIDFPARSIIRGRWEIGDYDLNFGVPEQVLTGPAIGGLQAPADSGGSWPTPLPVAIKDVARPIERSDLEAVRAEVDRLAEGRLLSGLPRTRLGFSSLSDLVRVNRVQGLAVGAGLALQATPHVIMRPRVAFGTSDHRLTADLRVTWERKGTALSLSGGRRISDFADRPVLSGVVNSLLAQEGGRDQGDYVMLDRVSLGASRMLGSSMQVGLEASAERSHSVRTEATAAGGQYRPNPNLGAGTIGVGRLSLSYRAESLERSRGLDASLQLEGGQGDRDYARAAAQFRWLVPAGFGALSMSGEAGAGTAQAPGYRSFAVGGWGTLLGEPFRAWGGRRMALASLEYRFDLPFPAVSLGAFASTGDRITVAPFLSAGWAGGPLPGLPWRPSGQLRPVAGLALEWFHRLIRAEAGVSLRTGALGVSIDFSREWWEVL